MEPGLRDRENAYRATRITGHVAAAMEPGLRDRENWERESGFDSLVMPQWSPA